MIRAMVEEEGRTVFLSSHLLDEVEKVCDAAAIVDRGRVVVQGPIGELTGAASHHELHIAVDDLGLALATLEDSELVREVHLADDGLRAVLADGFGDSARVNAALVHAGVAVSRLEPVRHSLEQRFLEITSRLDEPAAEDGRAGVTPAATTTTEVTL